MVHDSRLEVCRFESMIQSAAGLLGRTIWFAVISRNADLQEDEASGSARSASTLASIERQQLRRGLLGSISSAPPALLAKGYVAACRLPSPEPVSPKMCATMCLQLSVSLLRHSIASERYRDALLAACSMRQLLKASVEEDNHMDPAAVRVFVDMIAPLVRVSTRLRAELLIAG